MWYNLRQMTVEERIAARADIEATGDRLGVLENESLVPERTLRTPFGEVRIIPPELALVERILYAEQDVECKPSARQMMCAALNDASFDWAEAERLADLRDFKVLPQLRALKGEIPRA